VQQEGYSFENQMLTTITIVLMKDDDSKQIEEGKGDFVTTCDKSEHESILDGHMGNRISIWLRSLILILCLLAVRSMALWFYFGSNITKQQTADVLMYSSVADQTSGDIDNKELGQSIKSELSNPIGNHRITLEKSVLPSARSIDVPLNTTSDLFNTIISQQTYNHFNSSEVLQDGQVLKDSHITYLPGNLVVNENGMKLSQGLTSRLLAKKFHTVKYHSGSKSNEPFHDYPDGAATFLDPDPNNVGGWIYVSNSEYRYEPSGGVGAFRFNCVGNVTDYRMILQNTSANCGGGRTPWNVRYEYLLCIMFSFEKTCFFLVIQPYQKLHLIFTDMDIL
jgi:hypothetical protein